MDFLPTATEEMSGKVSKFKVNFGIIQALICNDGTHIHIIIVYMEIFKTNFGTTNSFINLQAICY